MSSLATKRIRSLSRRPTVDQTSCSVLAAEVAARKIHASAIRHGSALDELAHQHAESFRELLGDAADVSPNRVLTVGSTHTRSAEVLALRAMADVYAEIAHGFGV